MSANSRDMREFIGVRTEEKPRERKPYYEIRAKVIVHRSRIDVTAITDVVRDLPVFPIRINVIAHDHSSYIHERIWHLYDGTYKVAHITRDKTHVRIIEVKDGEARTVKEYITD
jgi:hypothetical protein